MNARRRLYLSGIIGAFNAYVFANLAFTGQVNLVAIAAFLVVFVVIFVAFERLIQWADRTDTA